MLVLPLEVKVPTHLVNLDALLEREDFESSEVSVGSSSDPLFKLEELRSDRLFFRVLRKPHFQRETNNWTPERIAEFVKSFLDNELIPAIIIWHSKLTNKIFVIDGAHRVSALIAWVHDDYGDGEMSRKANGYDVPSTQKKFHQITKELIEKEIGSFKQLSEIAAGKETPRDEVMGLRALAIGSRVLNIQRVDGEASVAETSFFKINGNAIPIDDTELDLLHARHKPNTLAARAFMRAGRGHKYWGKLPNAGEIETLAKKVYSLVFGQILEIGSTSPDIPKAGQPYSNEALKMVLDLVNTLNDVTPAMWQRPRKGKVSVKQLDDDLTGEITLAYLNKVKNVAQISSDNAYSGSFGLDHAVYCYGETGRFHPAALLASLTFAYNLHTNNKRKKFTEVRADFEEFLVRHKAFINILGHSKGSRTRSVESLLLMYKTVMESLLSGNKTDVEIMSALLLQPNLKALGSSTQTLEEDQPRRKKFSKAVQAAAIVKEVLNHRPRCPICGARIPPAARSKDHIQREEDGGLGGAENLRFTHPYCNSGKRESDIAEEAKSSEGTGDTEVDTIKL
jgi:hypothetical protein